MEDFEKYTKADYQTGATKLLKAPQLAIGKKLGIGRAPAQLVLTMAGKSFATPKTEQYNIILYAQVARGEALTGSVLMTAPLMRALEGLAAKGERDEVLHHSKCVFKFRVLNGKYTTPLYWCDLEGNANSQSSGPSSTAASASTMQPSSRNTARSSARPSDKPSPKSGPKGGRITKSTSK